MAKKKKPPTAEQLERDRFDGMMRRTFGLIQVYQSMLKSHLASESWDQELVTRMAATRECVLLLVESCMPVPVRAGEVRPVETKSRAIN